VNDVVIVPELSSAIEGARLVGDSQTEEWIHERWDQDVEKRQEGRAVWPMGVKKDPCEAQAVDPPFGCSLY